MPAGPRVTSAILETVSDHLKRFRLPVGAGAPAPAARVPLTRDIASDCVYPNGSIGCSGRCVARPLIVPTQAARSAGCTTTVVVASLDRYHVARRADGWPARAGHADALERESRGPERGGVAALVLHGVPGGVRAVLRRSLARRSHGRSQGPVFAPPAACAVSSTPRRTGRDAARFRGANRTRPTSVPALERLDSDRGREPHGDVSGLEGLLDRSD